MKAEQQIDAGYAELVPPSAADQQPFQTLGGSEWRRERADRGNPWSEKGLLLQWSWVLAHISWLLGCPLTAIRRPYSFKTLIGHL